jgi:hypothetical protein
MFQDDIKIFYIKINVVFIYQYKLLMPNIIKSLKLLRNKNIINYLFISQYVYSFNWSLSYI